MKHWIIWVANGKNPNQSRLGKVGVEDIFYLLNETGKAQVQLTLEAQGLQLCSTELLHLFI